MTRSVTFCLDIARSQLQTSNQGKFAGRLRRSESLPDPLSRQQNVTQVDYRNSHVIFSVIRNVVTLALGASGMSNLTWVEKGYHLGYRIKHLSEDLNAVTSFCEVKVR